MIDFYSNSGKIKLYSYTVDGNEVEVLDTEGKHVVKCLRNPNGGQWTDVERNEWGKKTAGEYNRLIADEIYKSKIEDLEVVYINSNKSRVTLSDGNVFDASKSTGDKSDVSLNNTINLIKSGCELAVFSGADSITLSDANNQDVVYEFDYSNPNPIYILPIIELAERTAIFFEAKRIVRNQINVIKTDSYADLDKLSEFNVRAVYNATIDGILRVKYPERYEGLEEDEEEY